MKNKLGYLLIHATYLGLLGTNVANADVPTVEDSISKDFSLTTTADAASVDPKNGNLKIHQVDLILKGSNGLNIELHRTYDLFRLSAALKANYIRSYNWAAMGPGWIVASAPRVYVPNYFTSIYNNVGTSGFVKYGQNALHNLCTGGAEPSGKGVLTEPRYNSLYLRLPNGGVQSFFWSGAYEAKTAKNWKLTCLSNNMKLLSPDGITYDMGNYTSNRKVGATYLIQPNYAVGMKVYQSPNTSETYIDPVRASDAYGNWLTYTYKQIGTPFTFDNPAGNQTTQPKISAGNSASLAESPSSVLALIKASDGRSLTFNYDTNTNRLLSVTDGSARKVQYTYLTEDTLNSNVLSTVTGPTGEKWQYKYQPGAFTQTGRFKESVIPASDVSVRKLTELTFPAGGSAKFEYEYVNITRATSNNSTAYDGLIRLERIKSKTLSDGNKWTYKYTRGGFGGTGEYDTTDVTGPDGVTHYEYFGAGLNSLESYSSTAMSNNIWRIGLPVKTIYPNGDQDSYTWQQRLLSNESRFLWEYGYNRDEKTWAADLKRKIISRGGATYTTTYSNYNQYGSPGSIIEAGPNGGNRTTTLTWFNDATKWIIGKPLTSNDGATSIINKYDTNGKLLSSIQNGVTTSYAYDAKGNIASTTLPGNQVYKYSNFKFGTPQSETQPEGINLSRVVDASGNVTSITDGAGYSTRFTYDGLNRITAISPPIGNPTTFNYTPTSQVETRGPWVKTTSLDSFGRVAKITQGGLTVTFRHDAYGRKVFESNPSATTGTTYKYDALGRLLSISHADGSSQSTSYGAATRVVTDERGKKTTYTYRGYGNPENLFLMSITAPEASANIKLARNSQDKITSVSQGGRSRTYAYNANGYLTSVVNPETGTTIFGRDISGKMTSKRVGTSGETKFTYDGQNRLISTIYPAPTPTVKLTYNKQGKLLTAFSSGGNRTMSYDAVGNLLKDTLTLGSNTFYVQYGYDANNNIIKMTYPKSGRVVNYKVDTLGRTMSIPGYINDVQYWPNGQLKKVTYANGTISSYGQNNRLWPANFSTQKSVGGQSYANNTYAYDGSGNLTSIKDTTDSKFNRTLTYDGINRIIGAAGYWGTGSITYDGVGNIVSQKFGLSTLGYSYDAQNRLKSTNGLRAANYSYDVYGNTIGSASNSYSYNDASDLICVNCANAASKIEYTYDGLGRRSSVTRAGNRTYEMYDNNNNPLVELNGQQLTEYIYLGAHRIAQRVSP